MKDKYYLDYINEDGEIRKELLEAVNQIKSKEFKINDFYAYLNNVLMGVNDPAFYDVLHRLSSVKPNYHCGALYYLLLDFCDSKKYKKELNYIYKFNKYDIEIFMIVNFLRKL